MQEVDRLEEVIKKIRYEDNIVDKLKYNLRHEGLEERSLRELRRVSFRADSAKVRRLASWELALWFADKETTRDARKGLKYLRRAQKGEEDSVRKRQIAIIAADLYSRMGKEKKRERFWSSIFGKGRAHTYF